MLAAACLKKLHDKSQEVLRPAQAGDRSFLERLFTVHEDPASSRVRREVSTAVSEVGHLGTIAGSRMWT